MTATLFEIAPAPTLPVEGESARYPVGRIFCVGQNYAAHAAEMGSEADREAPFYFTKTPTAAIESGATIPYPPGTANFHYEMELAVAIGAPVFRATREAAAAAVYAYGAALDMTRRDLQAAAKERQRPWDLAKDGENSAVFAPLTKSSHFTVANQRIHLALNGEPRQDATLDDMIHSVVDIIVDLSKYYHLRPGDLILTGTPAGVGPVAVGDRITGGIAGLAPISLTIGVAE